MDKGNRTRHGPGTRVELAQMARAVWCDPDGPNTKGDDPCTGSTTMIARPNVRVKPLLWEAQELHEKYDWVVFPTRKKRPAVKWKPLQTDEQTLDSIDALFATPGIDGIAVLSGRGLVVRDFDDPESYSKWSTTYPELAETLPTDRTKRGNHVFFQGPEGFQKMDDGEYRGTVRQYTVVPPSRHPDGGCYEWLREPSYPIPTVEDPVSVGLANYGFCGTGSALSPSWLELGRVGSSQNRPLTEEWIRDTVRKCLPTGHGQREQCLFKLARLAKGLNDHLDLPSMSWIFGEWWELARPIVRTKEDHVSFDAFRRAYRNCQIPGNWSWPEVVRQSLDEKLPDMARFYPAAHRDLLRLCARLQRLHGGGPFHLSVNVVGGLFGFSRMTASRMFRTLEEDGFLKRISVGSNLTRKASQYRYLPPLQLETSSPT